MSSVLQPFVLPQGFAIGTSQERWLDPKKPVTLKSTGVYDDEGDARDAAGKQAEASGRAVMIGEVHRPNSVAYGTFETTLTSAQGGRANVVLSDFVFEVGHGTLLVARDFALGERSSMYPMRAGEFSAWRRLELSVDSMRERAPLFKPSFSGSSADHVRTAIAYAGRALPDTLVVGINTGRQLPPGNNAIVAAICGAVGLAIDVVEVVPALAYSATHLLAAGAKAAFGK